jgi:hypothetical protein
MRFNRLLAPVAAVSLAVACSGESREATPVASPTTVEVVGPESPLCLALTGLEAALAEGISPTNSIAEIEAALAGPYSIGQTMDQLAYTHEAIATAEIVASDPELAEMGLLDQAKTATDQALLLNSC